MERTYAFRRRPQRARVDDAHLAGVTYRLQAIDCRSATCRQCSGGPSHGPYWYAFFRGSDGGKRTHYLGRDLPARVWHALRRRDRAEGAMLRSQFEDELELSAAPRRPQARAAAARR